MSIVSDLFGGDDSSSDAANAQVASSDRAIAFQKEALANVRSDLAPFKQAGQNALTGLQSLVTDPTAQKNYITNNPFYEALSTDATNKLYANKAAKGKLGSGGTLKELQNNLLTLGSDLLNQSITQRQNLATMGQNAAAMTGTATQNSANTISDLITGQGNATAAGIIGDKNTQTNAWGNLINSGLTAAWVLSDARAKEDIKQIGALDNGLPVYSFKYKGDDETHINVMAQDVEKVMPDAVKEFGGFKHVNMEMVACQ